MGIFAYPPKKVYSTVTQKHPLTPLMQLKSTSLLSLITTQRPVIMFSSKKQIYYGRCINLSRNMR